MQCQIGISSAFHSAGLNHNMPYPGSANRLGVCGLKAKYVISINNHFADYYVCPYHKLVADAIKYLGATNKFVITSIKEMEMV